MKGNGHVAKNEDEETSRQEEELPKSLDTLYGRTIGVVQSLSLLLNALLMVYAHVGLSAVFVSNQQNLNEVLQQEVPPIMTSDDNTTSTNISTSDSPESSEIQPADGVVLNGACQKTDYHIWVTPSPEDGLTGADKKSERNNFCAQEQGCTINRECLTDCMVNNFNYTRPCAGCLAAIPGCTLSTNFSCAFSTCAVAPDSKGCWDCARPCNAEFAACSGLSLEDITEPWLLADKTAAFLASQNEGESNQVSNSSSYHSGSNTGNSTAEDQTEEQSPNKQSVLNANSNKAMCDLQKEAVDVDNVDTFYKVWDVEFFSSMRTAWNNDAKLLAVVVVLFSFVWPYTKNVILMLAWYLPLSPRSRSSVLRWLRRLGKYTLLDVYVVLLLIVGVMLELTVGISLPVIARGEPRLAIIAFLVATLWEFVHIEWMTECHNNLFRAVGAPGDSELSRNKSDLLAAVRFDNTAHPLAFRNQNTFKCTIRLLLVITIGLFASGSSLELIRFTTVRTGDEGIDCDRSYNLYSFSLAAVGDVALHLNLSKWAVYVLVLAYMAFVVLVPWCVHLIQVLGIIMNARSKPLFIVADKMWTFASVEVFLISVFVLESKFDRLVSAIAGEEGAALFAVTSELGVGFYILIAYSVCGSLIQHIFSSAVAEFYETEPHHKVHMIWTRLLKSCLTPEPRECDVKSDEP